MVAGHGHAVGGREMFVVATVAGALDRNAHFARADEVEEEAAAGAYKRQRRE